MKLPNHIRMRIVRAVEQNARFDSREERRGYLLTATVDGHAKVVFSAEQFTDLHQAISFLLELREQGTADERRRQHKRSEDARFYRAQAKAKSDSAKSARVDRLRAKFYGRAA